MIEVRFHGRGGQGAVTAAELLAVAIGMRNKYSQSFPMFGVERRGAPVQAFCRIDDKPIRVHKAVYNPDYVVVLDSTLLDNVDVCNGIKERGVVIINTHLSKDEIKKRLKCDNATVYTVDAYSIAVKHLGKPIVNTAMLGAFAKIADWVDLQNLEDAIKERFEDEELIKKNVAALKECYDTVQ